MKRPLPFHSNAVWPPLFLVVSFVFMSGFVALGLWLIEAAAPQSAGDISNMEEFVNIRTGLLAGAAGVYAIYRIWRFHPACNHAYAAWLKLSPWTAAKPLPLGPVHPVWQDAVVIGMLAAVAKWHAHVNPLWPVAISVLIYLVGMTVMLAYTRTSSSSTILGFLWPAMLLPWLEGWPIAVLGAAIVVVIWHAHRKSMRAFPWETLKTSSQSRGSVLNAQIKINSAIEPSAEKATAGVGWPFAVLSPKIHCYSISTINSFTLSAEIGWWCFCLIKRFEIEPLPEAILLVTLFAAMIRLVIYCSGITTPLNVWGRIASGNLLIPGFDKVFPTPLAAVLVAVIGGMIIRRSGSLYPVAESVVIAAIWLVLFLGGPRLRNWILTGQHRFRIPARANASKQMLRQV